MSKKAGILHTIRGIPSPNAPKYAAMSVHDSMLGKATLYPQEYAPERLFAIPRLNARRAIALDDDLPFHGTDIWNAWELTWLSPTGQPIVATCEIRVPADSPNLIESKSLKLYLGSIAMTQFGSRDAVVETLQRDLSEAAGSEVGIALDVDANIESLSGACLDELVVECDAYHPDAALLSADASAAVSECLYSHLLRSLCPVTGQPDIGSVQICYEGGRIDRAGLLRYLVSFRQHNDFHEACVERIFVDIQKRCAPQRLTVFARYQRRGGIDINPFRSDSGDAAPNARVWRQ